MTKEAAALSAPALKTRQTSKSELAKRIVWTVLLNLLGLIMIVPFAWMLSAAFKRPLDVFSYPIQWIPDYWYPNNFLKVWDPKFHMLRAYWNSAKISVIITFGAVVTSALPDTPSRASSSAGAM